MPPEGLNPGDRVVELAGLLHSAAIATGALAGAWLLWLIKKSWIVSVGALIGGAALGFVVAHVLARLLYRTAEGNTTVVKLGSASLTSTIPAGLAGGVTTAVAVGVLAVLIFGAKDQAWTLFSVSLGCGFVLGVLFACLGSLT
jgi:hypothetical protein